MIVGIGIDIIEVDRMADKVSKEEFRKKVFSQDEIDFCESKGNNKAQHYAARFSAKEAFLKATGMGMLLSLELKELEVRVTKEGKPFIHLSGEPARLAEQNKWRIHVTLSHIQPVACAMVVIETTEMIA
jgi:holo-[acyl-carrier protein] synthase